MKTRRWGKKKADGAGEAAAVDRVVVTVVVAVVVVLLLDAGDKNVPRV